ncbi:MAG TPA: cytochrome ubiquinol oxidase subunit I [Thermoanaerobaculia bacterium]|nr:cytochrome ubiquinol oxidase subunit I [Thermoanaerobaculia bacterium]HQR66721.1 cytochrome ubiquinol oxidase subunit I [Thermoanaerobaculia bacterium]
MDYPIWDIAVGGGVLIGVIAVLHVVVSHFAVGGGLVMAFLEARLAKGPDPALRALLKRASLMLILVSTVFGALSGVGIWFVIGLVHPAATSALIHTFVWGWAIEWAFFLLEVVTALAWYATWDRVRPRTHRLLIVLYAVAAFMSLVVIQGILGFMLTPGRWLATYGFWDGFLNPTYLPGLLFRTGVCLLLAGTYLMLAALREADRGARVRLVGLLARIEVAGLVLATAGLFWWKGALPPEVQANFLGAKPLIASLATGWRHLFFSLGASAFLALLAALLPRSVRWPQAVLALVAAFGLLGGYERAREGARKPFVVRGYMFSNGILVSEVERLNRDGILSKARWAAHEAGRDPLSRGRAVFRAECAACHTLDGYLSIRKRTAAADADFLTMFLTALRDDGARWTATPPGKPDYPFMPPFVGTDEELSALVTYLDALKQPGPAKTAEVTRAR